MKIDLENITIEQYMYISLMVQTYKEDVDKLNAELIKYVYGDLDVSKKEADKTIQDLTGELMLEPDFVHRFEYQGVEYGFIPNLDEISTAEFIDLDDYIKEGSQLNKIAAILYRPITSSNKMLYQIEKYEGTSKYSEIMKGVNYKVAVGAVVFFCNLSKSLLKALDTYTQKMNLAK